MSRMMEIAGDLAALYRDQKQAELELWHNERDQEARRTAITPSEGWPGKNEAERKLAAERTFANDEVLIKIRAAEVEIRHDLADLAGLVAGLEAERRALEWEIRERMAQALAGSTENGRIEEASGADQAGDRLWQSQPADVPF